MNVLEVCGVELMDDVGGAKCGSGLLKCREVGSSCVRASEMFLKVTCAVWVVVPHGRFARL